MTIRVLFPLEASRIAAGEVIERPASVVKELVENSLDAGATQITVDIRDGGLTSIRVVDDGCGIAGAELRLAFERHATSKLQAEADPWRIETLGFRGEALPSIAAAADVEITSRPSEQAEGRRLRFVAGEAVEEGPEASPPGTAVAVRALFRRQPARLKFLRSAASEAGHVGNVVSRYALAYPEVRFTLRADGRPALQAPGTGDLREAAAAVYGAQVVSSLLDVCPYEDVERMELALQGLVSPPHVTRATRNDISLFINRRWVRNRALTFAVEEGYQGQLQSGRHPLAIVYVRLPADDVDVNVHPAKAEVRLRREREVFGAIRDAVRATLNVGAPVTEIAAPRVWGTPPAGGVLPGPEGSEVPDLALASPAYQPELTPHAPGVNGATAGVPMLRPVGQVGNLYVVAESAEGLYLIDQHAAHERVLYERLLAALETSRPETQPLLQPATVELTPRQQALLSEYGDELRAQGFDIEPFGEGAWALRAVPSAIAADAGKAFAAVLDLLDREDGSSERRHRVAASLACHAAVRAGKTLSGAEMRELVEQLEATASPRTCPHGRPTMLHLSADHLAREFRRR